MWLHILFLHVDKSLLSLLSFFILCLAGKGHCNHNHTIRHHSGVSLRKWIPESFLTHYRLFLSVCPDSYAAQQRSNTFRNYHYPLLSSSTVLTFATAVCCFVDYFYWAWLLSWMILLIEKIEKTAFWSTSMPYPAAVCSEDLARI